MFSIHFALTYLNVQSKQFFGADVLNIVRPKLEENIRPIGQPLYQNIEMTILASYVHSLCSDTVIIENLTLKTYKG